MKYVFLNQEILYRTISPQSYSIFPVNNWGLSGPEEVAGEVAGEVRYDKS